jgi:hypothetical protein
VGTRLSCRDVLSPYARRLKGITIERLDRFDEQEGDWREVLVEARTAGPAETAAARIDVGTWFRLLSSRNQRIAEMLARGEKTGAVANEFGLSAGRISQLRARFEASWESFQDGCNPHDVGTSCTTSSRRQTEALPGC